MSMAACRVVRSSNAASPKGGTQMSLKAAVPDADAECGKLVPVEEVERRPRQLGLRRPLDVENPPACEDGVEGRALPEVAGPALAAVLDARALHERLVILFDRPPSGMPVDNGPGARRIRLAGGVEPPFPHRPAPRLQRPATAFASDPSHSTVSMLNCRMPIRMRIVSHD